MNNTQIGKRGGEFTVHRIELDGFYEIVKVHRHSPRNYTVELRQNQGYPWPIFMSTTIASFYPGDAKIALLTDVRKAHNSDFDPQAPDPTRKYQILRRRVNVRFFRDLTEAMEAICENELDNSPDLVEDNVNQPSRRDQADF